MTVIEHIQRILKQCGDSVILQPTGGSVVQGDHNTDIAFTIKDTLVLAQNSCCTIPSPTPMRRDNPEGKYWINVVRISHNMIDDYSKESYWTDDQIRNLMICKKEWLFGYIEKE